MKNKKIIFCSAFKYVVPADYEWWFENLAVEGWHPVKIGQWSSIAMRFAKSEPKKYRYVLDMLPSQSKDYKRIYEEFGWEHVGQMASAHVWRKMYTDERPESFSDAPSLVERNRRFINAISISFTLFLFGAIGFAAGALFSDLTVSDRIQFGIASGLFLLITVLLGLAMKNVKKNIKR